MRLIHRFTSRPLNAVTFALIVLCAACGETESPTATPASAGVENIPLFTLLPSERTGIEFQNVIQENDRVNYFKYEYLYNGGGVAVGDVNNDGLPDLYLTGNMTSNRLYVNRGDLRFEEITAHAKASYLNDWCTGVTMADVNNDGWLDIYVSASGYYEDPEVRRNILFVNNGDAAAHDGKPTFTDRAAEYGIDDIGFSIQSVFFDYDNDGDLDLYVANHPNEFREAASVVLRKMKNPPLENTDRLYRNDTEDGEVRFTEVSAQAGIVNYAHTLGIVAADFDGDGWTDIYASNDYQQPDYLYRNQGDGTFVNIIDAAVKHQAKFSMGVDANDFNNDGLIDLMAVEMMAEDNERQKTNMAPMNPQDFDNMVQIGFGHQYMHNALQLNNGVVNGGDVTFSEVAYLAGVATTDWSWSPLFADFDNDGWKDLFVANGYRRDMLDKDFKIELKKMLASGTATYADIREKIPGSTLPNYVFRNAGDLTFTKKSEEWQLADAVNTNGAAYADLDLDGDLDLVLNNIDTVAFVYRNELRERAPAAGNYLRVRLRAAGPNRDALGARVTIKTESGRRQYQELTLTRGYQSSVEPILHFGLGGETTISALEVRWPNGTVTTLTDVAANQLLEITDAAARPPARAADASVKLFRPANDRYGITHRHRDTPYDDYAKQVLLPHKMSEHGPALAVSDVNGDGLDDFYVGGAAGFPGVLHLQGADGTFTERPVAAFTEHRANEDQGAVFFDADGDGDLDLIVTGGSYEFAADSPPLHPRLYLNDGAADFQYAPTALPDGLRTNASCVAAGDYDGDGDLDLFIGGRVVAGQYPRAAASYLLENVGGRFEERNEKLTEAEALGMVTGALWTDYDNDDDLDLICVGEWMPVTLFTNLGGSFDYSTLPNSTGWWTGISGGDFDHDGDIDYVLGNLGLNSKNRASLEQPFHVYGDDFDDNGNFDIVLGYYYNGVQYPVRGLQCSSEQIPDLKKKIPSYKEFGNATLTDVYGAADLENALHLTAVTFASSLLVNEDGRDLTLRALPLAAQVAPVTGTLLEDLDGDGCVDLLLVGNQYAVEVETGRYDAFKGLFLNGDCEGDFTPVPARESGFFVDRDARALSLGVVDNNQKTAVFVTSNRGETGIFELRPAAAAGRAEQTRKREYYWGGGYLSQRSRRAAD